jgi:hypothetical protein
MNEPPADYRRFFLYLKNNQTTHKMNYTICYISKSVPELKEEEIEEIFRRTQSSNNERNIKGILLYEFGNFFQVLEGKKEVIEDLYHNKIREDTRHTDIQTLINYDIKEPIFKEYSSNFNIIKTRVQLESIRSYLTQNHHHHFSENIKRLLNTFLL